MVTSTVESPDGMCGPGYVIYSSEELMTMISSVTDNLPAPSKIVEWLRFEGLSRVVRPK